MLKRFAGISNAKSQDEQEVVKNRQQNQISHQNDSHQGPTQTRDRSAKTYPNESEEEEPAKSNDDLLLTKGRREERRSLEEH